MASVSYWEMFTGQDWERGSEMGGKVCVLTCVAVGIASAALGWSIGIALWTIFVGLLISVWEVPFFYSAFRQCEEAKTTVLDKLFLKKHLVKSVLYILLSILCYTKNTLCIIAGISLNLESLLLIFAAINERVDAADGLTTDDDVSEAGSKSLLASGKFGTF
jgi:hypothetical protein